MGRFAKSNIDLSSNNVSLELNEGNIQSLFKQCLGIGNSSENVGYILFREKYGYEKDESPIIFNRNAVLANKMKIEYLFGQLQTVHLEKTIITPSSIATNYKGENWTQNKRILLEFLHLGFAAQTFHPFSKTKFGSNAILYPLAPTLSPKDSNFPDWWEEHKAKWEVRKKGGQESANL